MMNQFNVKCIDNYDHDELKLDNTYPVTTVLDKEKWSLFIGDTEYIVEKWRFEHVVEQYVKYPKFYGEMHLPLLHRENESNFVVMTPTGYATSVNIIDVEVYEYNELQRVDCSEVRFR